MAHPTQAIPFSPPADLIPLILDQITDPALSLRDIAAANSTTTEALSLWLSSPEIRKRLELLDSAACTRVRQLANAQLDTVLLTLRTIQLNFHAHTAQLRATASRATGCGRFGPQPVQSTSDAVIDESLPSDPRNPRQSAASPLPTSDIPNPTSAPPSSTTASQKPPEKPAPPSTASPASSPPTSKSPPLPLGEAPPLGGRRR